MRLSASKRTCAVNREHSWQKMHPHSRQWCRRTKTENGTCEAFLSLPLGLTPRRLGAWDKAHGRAPNKPAAWHWPTAYSASTSARRRCPARSAAARSETLRKCPGYATTLTPKPYVSTPASLPRTVYRRTDGAKPLVG